jgi:uncharacterized membrane protein YccC
MFALFGLLAVAFYLGLMVLPMVVSAGFVCFMVVGMVVRQIFFVD